MTTSSLASGPDYRTWQRGRIQVGNRALAVATKPGVFAHGHEDPAAVMLAEAVTAQLARRPAATVMSFACGNGVVGAAAAVAGARRVWMTDRHGLAVQAAQRTIDAQTHSSDVQIFTGHGAHAMPADERADIVAIRVIPERIPVQLLLHDAAERLRVGGVCLLAGGNHEGAKSAARALETLFGNVQLVAQHSSHRLVVASRPSELPVVPADSADAYRDPSHCHEIPVALNGLHFTLFTRPGVFSWEHLDEASRVLAGLIDVAPGERVLDIGCGAGALGTVAALQSGTGAVCLVDVDSEAVQCARRTITTAGAKNGEVFLSDVAAAVQGRTFDLIVANPPFHVGKQTNLDVPRQFIREASELLRPGGRFMAVANRTLPYEQVVREAFGNVETLHDGPRFKVLGARQLAT